MSTVIAPTIVYSPQYDLTFWPINRLHVFDGRKYSRVWKLLRAQFGEALLQRTERPPRPVTDSDLRLVHTLEYLHELRSPTYVARALEIPVLSRVPMFLLEWQLLRRMRLGMAGTLLAAERALQCGTAVNLSGGYHHASAERGEGFTVYSDIAFTLERLRMRGVFAAHDTAMIIDLDAHQGNGYERIFHYRRKGIYIFDMYNRAIYPNDELARERIDYEIRVDPGCDDETYLTLLRRGLPEALRRMGTAKLAVYVAGTDIYEQDQLGMMRVSAEGVFERDKFVFEALAAAGIPVVMTLAGGYSQESYRLIARTLTWLLEKHGAKRL